MTMIKPYKKCRKCGALIVSGSLCEDCKPMTNGDKIRAMTDEELAESLSGSVACTHVTGCLDTSCYECTLEWLKQEVIEDGNET